MDIWNKDYISQPLLQLEVGEGLSSSQWVKWKKYV